MSIAELHAAISDQGLKHDDCGSREALEQRALVAIKHREFHEARRLRQEETGAVSSPTGLFGQRRQLKPAKLSAGQQDRRGGKTKSDSGAAKQPKKKKKNNEADSEYREGDDDLFDDTICVPSDRRMIQNDCVPKGFSASEGCSVM
jgi:hypothetical protein